MTTLEERDTDEALRTLQRVHSSYRETLTPEQHLRLSMRLRDWLGEAIGTASGYCDEPEPPGERPIFVSGITVVPRQGSARPVPDDGSTRLAEAAQRLADEHGEEVLLIPPGHPTLESGTRQIPYLTLSSVADEWEWQKATARVQPAKR
jgi:hypothetical protein